MSDPLDYIARKNCGCFVAWIAGDEPPKRLAKAVSDWIREGYSVERCSTEDARNMKIGCPHKNRDTTAEALL